MSGGEKLVGRITECSICLETLTQPKLLPCSHTFCLTCLQTYSLSKTPKDTLLCPMCQGLFKVPTEGLDKLPSKRLRGASVKDGKKQLGAVYERHKGEDGQAVTAVSVTWWSAFSATRPSTEVRAVGGASPSGGNRPPLEW